MAKRGPKCVLFLDTGADRAWAAQTLFNGVAVRMGLPWLASARELPALTADDFERADWIVALNQPEHRPLLRERFPERVETVEFWYVAAGPAASALIEREVMDLTARLIVGGKRADGPLPELRVEEPRPVKSAGPKTTAVRVGRETKGRRGKGVTIISDLPLNEADLSELAGKLKQRCGTGGTVKDGRIEIQGDHRDRLVGELEGMGYRVKRVGG